MLGGDSLSMRGDAVIYLCRKGDPAVAHTAFFKSLAANPFGIDADLVVVLKGFEPQETPQSLTEFRKSAAFRIDEVRVKDEGSWAINAFFEAARQAPHDRLLFLTSHSRIRAKNWLRFYSEAFERVPNCGVAGASGSYEAVTGVSFPNINIRTNAFMIARQVFNQLDTGSLATKRGGYEFEAGPNSLTRQLERRGLQPVVVDRIGNSWQSEDWPESNTFRSGLQQGLLVADNRTHDFDIASNGKRRRLAKLAFGDRARVTHVSLMRRLQAKWQWRLSMMA